MKDLAASEYALRKTIFNDYEFTIPDYQRPYAWGKEQAPQLLDHMEGALARDTDEPDFLGSIVLVKAGSGPQAEVIDGIAGPNGSAVFALMTQVLTLDVWTPAVIEARHRNLFEVLHKEWELN